MSREEEGSNANRISDFHGGHGSSCLVGRPNHRPRRSSPFRLSYVFGLWLNWPLLTFLVLVASTALAIDQSGVDSLWLWIGLGLAVIASAGLVVQCSSTSTRSSVASVSERATCSIGSPARIGYASAQTTAVPPTADYPIR